MMVWYAAFMVSSAGVLSTPSNGLVAIIGASPTAHATADGTSAIGRTLILLRLPPHQVRLLSSYHTTMVAAVFE